MTGQYVAGEVVQLTAAPASGWHVAGWTGTQNDASQAATNTLTMPAAAHSVSVAYQQDAPPDGMVLIPAGTFQMGCDPAHNGGYSCSSNELPLRTHDLSAYYIDIYEVTNAQYAQCVSAGDCTALSSSRSKTHTSYYGNPTYADYPVVRATWHQANAYCLWRNKRLPTEAEWEKAARGSGTPYAFPWGDQAPTCQLANFGGSPDPAPVCVGDTLAVNSYATVTSQYGAINMAGNVWEWVQDWYQGDYYTVSPVSNPPGPATGTLKVLRGGSWWEDPQGLRTAGREAHDPAYDSGTYYSFGFRCVDDP